MCKENVNSWKSYILTYIKSYFMFDKTFTQILSFKNYNVNFSFIFLLKQKIYKKLSQTYKLLVI